MFCGDGDKRRVFLDTIQIFLLSRTSVSNGKTLQEDMTYYSYIDYARTEACWSARVGALISDQTEDHNRQKLILSYQLSPFIKRSDEKFLFQHRAQNVENG